VCFDRHVSSLSGLRVRDRLQKNFEERGVVAACVLIIKNPSLAKALLHNVTTGQDNADMDKADIVR
jgi:hypothetical protein